MSVSRRQLLQGVAYGVGLLAALDASTTTAQPTRRGRVTRGSQRIFRRFNRDGNRIVIIGAGISGLVTAYDILKKYPDANLAVLEANHWVGGRLLTVRTGDRFAEVGREQLTCSFDEGLYMNAGAGRIPHHHTDSLDLCRELDIPLEPFVLASRANLLHDENPETPDNPHRVYQSRRIKHDLRGHISEAVVKLLEGQGSRAMSEALEISNHEDALDELKCLFQRFGDLDGSTPDYDHCKTPDGTVALRYENSSRRGYSTAPGAWLDKGQLDDILSMDQILESDLYQDNFRDMRHYWQASLMQPSGGMDNLAHAVLAARVGRRRVADYVFYNTPITGISRGADGRISVRYRGARGDTELLCDKCVSTMAPPLLADMLEQHSHGFPEDYLTALRRFNYVASCKVGWQSNERFWERNDNIYGGISYTSDIISQIWYPSSDFHSDKGVLTGAYNRGEPAEEFGGWSHDRRIDHAYNIINAMHPGAARHIDRKQGLSLAWQNMPYHAGGWAEHDEGNEEAYEKVASQPIANFICSGDFMSYTPGWINGAVGSGRKAAGKILTDISVGA